MNNNRPTIVALGEVLWDMLPGGKKIGGAPLNFACHATQLGCKGVMVSCIGKDALGDELLEGIAHIGVELSFVQRSDRPTSKVDVVVDSQGKPQYIINEGVAWDHILFTPEMDALAQKADAVCWGSLAARSETSRTTIIRFVESTREDCLKVFDINIRQHYYDKEFINWGLTQANVLKLNDDELPLLQGYYSLMGDPIEQCRELLERFGLRYVVYTCGSKESVVVGAEDISRIDTPKVEVVDTVGAGDSFTAAFVSGLIRGDSIAETHRHAVDIAAYVCTQAGAIPALPVNLQ